jgi:hypothetical protein
MFDEVFFELCISSLIRRPMRIAELIEGDIFDTFLERGAEPLIDEGGTSLDRIGGRIRECDEVDRVITDIVETGESCDSPSLTIDEPLSHFARIK